mmetsp:Transcript_62816/g.192122  ORF Transcript_62816/g.192122 Transcript_62816/m.192122 type:complete len:339 (-) Transcript_62816:51-1067(-)
MVPPEDSWDVLELGSMGDISASCLDESVLTGHHPEKGITALQMIAIFGITSSDHESRIVQALDLGADPHLKAASWCDHEEQLWKGSGDEKRRTVVDIEYRGKSAIGTTAQLLRDMQDNQDDNDHERWSEDIKKLRRAMSLMCRAPRRSARVSVDCGIVNLWEELRRDADSHDVTLVTAEGDVSAHRAVLVRASPVLGAMLASSMREGRQQRVEIKDTPKQSAVLFLDLLYAGTSTEDLDAQIALAALDLAHRWQAAVVLRMLEWALAAMLSDANFAVIVQAAATKGLEQLGSMCKGFANDSMAVKSKVRAGNFPPAVLNFLHGRKEAGAPAAKKRRTF